MTYLTRQYGSTSRRLLKALREVPHEIEQQLVELDDDAAAWRPAAGEWSAAEVAGFLRESEREDLRAVRAMLTRDGAAIAERRAYLAPGKQNFAWQSLHTLWSEFVELRERLLWTLELAEGAWDCHGVHPYRGAVTFSTWVHEVSERDLEAAWSLRKLAEQRPPAASGARRRRRRAAGGGGGGGGGGEAGEGEAQRFLLEAAQQGHGFGWGESGDAEQLPRDGRGGAVRAHAAAVDDAEPGRGAAA
ncbi:MAG: DinB family protein [Chloroflexi bacterium]|nr:DinB family protein [Chloroflexota bacterium]